MMKPNRALISAMLVGVLFALSAQAATEAEIKADLLSVKIVAAIDSKRFAEAERLFEQYDATGVQMPQSLKLQRAMVSVGLGKFYLAKLQLEAFLRQANRGAEGYAQALTILTEVTPKAETDVAGKETVMRANALAAMALTPKCKTLTSKGDESCWMKVGNQPDCYTYQELVGNNHTVTWSGPCYNGKPEGEGTVIWKYDSGSESMTGLFVDGKRQGHWVHRDADGDVDEGSFVDDKKHGHWIERFGNGLSVSEGSYVDGKRHGHWIEKIGDDNVLEGPYVNGERHGHWVERWANDTNVNEGPYVNGKRHGRWIERLGDSIVQEGRYVDDKKHGQWVVHFFGEYFTTRLYHNGELVEE